MHYKTLGTSVINSPLSPRSLSLSLSGLDINNLGCNVCALNFPHAHKYMNTCKYVNILSKNIIHKVQKIIDFARPPFVRKIMIISLCLNHAIMKKARTAIVNSSHPWGVLKPLIIPSLKKALASLSIIMAAKTLR